jgi:hypothetical protein
MILPAILTIHLQGTMLLMKERTLLLRSEQKR